MIRLFFIIILTISSGRAWSAEVCRANFRSELFPLKSLSELSESTCKDISGTKECQDLYAKLSPEERKEKALKCDDPQSRSRIFESSWQYLSGCAIGVMDPVISLGKAIAETADAVAAEKKANDICDKDFDMKKALFVKYNELVPKLMQVTPPTDAVLKNTNCASVKSTIKMLQNQKNTEVMMRINSKIHSNTKLTVDEIEFTQWEKKNTLPNNSIF